MNPKLCGLHEPKQYTELMIAELIPAVNALSLHQKWLLANELWEEVEERQKELPTTDEVRSIVEQRFAEFERDPSTAMTLEEFKSRHLLP